MDFAEKVFVSCVIMICWLISGQRMFRKREWIADFNKDEIDFMPEYANIGHYVYKYTLAGAIIRSVTLGVMVSFVLYITSWLWVGIVNDMTLGMIWVLIDGEILIFVIGIIAALLYLRHISEDIIREIKVDE